MKRTNLSLGIATVAILILMAAGARIPGLGSAQGHKTRRDSGQNR